MSGPVYGHNAARKTLARKEAERKAKAQACLPKVKVIDLRGMSSPKGGGKR